MEKTVRLALSNYNHYLVDAQLYEERDSMMCGSVGLPGSPLTAQKKKDYALLEKKVAVITCWLKLLNDHEAFVIRRRVINGVGWRQVEAEHKEKFGHQSRCARTLKRYQTSGMKKMVAFANEYADVVRFLFDDNRGASEVGGGGE